MFIKQVLSYKACENNQLRSRESIKGLSQLQKFFIFYFLLISKATIQNFCANLQSSDDSLRFFYKSMEQDSYIFLLCFLISMFINYDHMSNTRQFDIDFLNCYEPFRQLPVSPKVSRLCDCSKCPFTFTILEWKKL